MTDITNKIEEMNRTLADLRSTQEQNETARDTLLESKLAAQNDHISNLETQIRELAQKAIRPATNEVESGSDESAEFKNFVRYGIETRAGQASVNTGTNAAGGYAVPRNIDKQIVNSAVHLSDLASRVSTQSASSPDTRFMVNRRGSTLAWVDETGTAGMHSATLTPELAEVVVPFGNLFGKALISNWSINDLLFDPEKFVVENMSNDIALKVEEAIISGSGSAQPKGILSYTTAATADATRAFGTIEHVASGTSAQLGVDTATKIAKLDALIYAMKPQHRARAKFVMNRLTIAEYRGLTDSNGQYLWQPSNIAGQPATLRGFDVVEAEGVAVKAANALPIIFGDLAAYRLYDLVGMSMLRDPFSYDAYVALKMNKRLGGCLGDTDAIKVLKCSAS